MKTKISTIRRGDQGDLNFSFSKVAYAQKVFGESHFQSAQTIKM